MCGVSFYYSQTKAFSSELAESLRMTSHRGPDSQGSDECVIGGAFVGLGHNRLSIVDLSIAGKQPMHNEKGCSIIFNGEIYNFKRLREMLLERGVSFVSHTDTEVILELYSAFGLDAFALLEGMFAIVLLDRSLGVVHFIRDFVGVKPLYVGSSNGSIFVSSEIRGLRPFFDAPLTVDKDDVYSFFNNGFLYEPNTGFAEVKKAMPGTVLTLDLANGQTCETKFNPNVHDRTSLFQDKIEKAIHDQLEADVPVGIFFSGGMDSSILAGLSGKSDLFFAEYSSDVNADIDKIYSKKIADFLGKRLIVSDLSGSKVVGEPDSAPCDSSCKSDELIEQVKFVARNTEELVSDYTFWSTYCLSDAARKNGYKVMLSGMGGDEIFAGYPRYQILRFDRVVRLGLPILKLLLNLRMFPKRLDKRFARLVSYASESNWGVAYSRLLGYFSGTELQRLFGPTGFRCRLNYRAQMDAILAEYTGDARDRVKLGQFFDRRGFLSHNLIVSDKASMLASLELRVPLLNEYLVLYGTEQKSRDLIGFRIGKKPLRNVLLSLLPSRFINRPKTGFNPPLDGLIADIGKSRLQAELLPLEGYLDFQFVNELVEEHFNGKVNNSYKIWQLLYFSFWLAQSDSVR